MAVPWWTLSDKGEKVLLDETTVAPSPCKDYCQIIVSTNQVIYRCWKVSLKVDAKAAVTEAKNNYEDFLDDDRLHAEIRRTFGERMLQYVKGLAEGQIDYITRLPDHLIIKIFLSLPLEDINGMTRTCRRFYKLCNSQELWKAVYLQSYSSKQLSAAAAAEIEELAGQIGWKRLLFTNKLQLQVLLRRQVLRHPASGDSCHNDDILVDSSSKPDQTESATISGDTEPMNEDRRSGDDLTRNLSNLSTITSNSLDLSSSSSSAELPTGIISDEMLRYLSDSSSSSSCAVPTGTAG